MSKAYPRVIATDPNTLPKSLEFPIVEAKMMEKWESENTLKGETDILKHTRNKEKKD